MSYPGSHPMADHARSFSHREEHGYLPDDVFVPGPEDDPSDPEQQEIRALVEDRYAENNRRRQGERTSRRIQVLENLLEENGIDVPEDL